MFSSTINHLRTVLSGRLLLVALTLVGLASCARQAPEPQGKLYVPPRIQVGVNVSPEWLHEKEQGKRFEVIAEFQRLRRSGVEALEFYPHPQFGDLQLLQQLIDEVATLGFVFAFHLPYDTEHGFNIVGFAGPRRAEYQSRFRPLLALAARYARPGHPIPVVVHGPRGYGSRSALVRDTVAFLDWISSEFPQLRPALENLQRASRQEKIGLDKAELLSIVRQTRSPNVGLCWDLGHDVLKGTAGTDPPGWLARVNHIHVHDVDAAGRDHHPLVFGRVPYQQMLDRLRRAGTRAAELRVTLETQWPHLVEAAAGQDPYRVLEESVRKLRRALGAP